MEGRAQAPTWGILVEVPLGRVREFLTPLGDVFTIRTNGSWTAAFCMEPGNDRYDEVVAPLRFRGHAPIYLFDFSTDEFTTSRWDGETWTLLEESARYVSPGSFLHDVGIKVPYWDELPPMESKPTPVEVREAIVAEGVSVEQVRVLVGDRWRVEPGPRGAIVYDPDNEARFALWDHAPGRILEIKFYPEHNRFKFRIIRGDECLGTFRPGETCTSDGTPFLSDVEGETDPEVIVEKLGIPRSFVDLPSATPRGN